MRWVSSASSCRRIGLKSLVHWVFRFITAATTYTCGISGKGAEVSVDPRDMPPVVIECRGRVEQLEPGHTIRFPAST
jgi:hypothetical protein